MTTTSNFAGWLVGQGSTEQGERVAVAMGSTTLLLTVEAANQFATSLLIAAKNVEAVNAADPVLSQDTP